MRQESNAMVTLSQVHLNMCHKASYPECGRDSIFGITGIMASRLIKERTESDRDPLMSSRLPFPE